MAIRKGNFLKGIIGNIVLRVVDNKQIASQKVAAGTIKHTEATKKSNQTFGMASSLAADIRRSIQDVVAGKSDLTMASRLSGDVFTVLTACRDKQSRKYHFEPDSFALLERFNFNRAYPVEKRMNRMPALSRQDGLLTVAFPEITIPEVITFPYNSYRCRLSVSVSIFRLEEGKRVEKCLTKEMVLLKAVAPVRAFEFEFQVPDGCFYVAGMYLEYATRASSGSKIVYQPRLNSGCILQAKIVNGQYPDDDKYRWIEMTNAY